MFLQRSLRCFYCGKSAAQKRQNGLRRWKCSHCMAVNYLDERGNITDPPASDSTTFQTRYATRGKPITSPELGQSNEGIFCNTCVKNQYLVAHNLAEYLPEPDDPRYARYEQNLPQYRASLEARYPQVCRNCEPRVRERLKLTGYAAKTDHLRRLAESTRQARGDSQERNGLHLLVMGGGMCWWLAHISQVFWHARSLSRLIPALNSYSLDKLGQPNDIFRLLGSWGAQVDSKRMDNSIATVSLAATLCSIWWNPTLNRVSRRGWRGVREFYKLQAVLSVVRFASWQLLESENLQDLATRRAIHAISLGFNLFVLLISQTTIKPAPLPQVSFELKDESISTETRNRSFSGSDFTSADGVFPIEKLRSAQTALKTWSGPPTPPPEDESDDEKTVDTTVTESDAMDIDTPERMQTNWSPRKVIALQASQRYPEPSPFRGHLPPAPIGPAHKLRNPPNKPTFQKVSDSRQKSFFESMTKSGGVYGNESAEGSSTPQRREIQLAPPHFFASSQEETGLESLFTGLISLSDEPSEIRQANQAPSASPVVTNRSSGLRIVWTLVETIFAISAAVWAQFTYNDSPWCTNLRTGTFTVILVDSLFGLYDQLRRIRFLADVIMHTVEALFSGGLIACHGGLWRPSGFEEPLLQDLGKGLICFFAVRKFFGFAQTILRRKVSSQPGESTALDRDRLPSGQLPSSDSPAMAKTSGLSLGLGGQRRQHDQAFGKSNKHRY